MFWISFEMTETILCTYSVRVFGFFSLISIYWIFHMIGNPAVNLKTLQYANATVTTCKLYVINKYTIC